MCVVAEYDAALAGMKGAIHTASACTTRHDLRQRRLPVRTGTPPCGHGSIAQPYYRHLHLTGSDNIATGLRKRSRQTTRPLNTLDIA
ncbi:hypothetical protein Sm713_60670 [Streptomyces sp. TS71-3]|nr:hypothetical protein Sm713_60670 [Streptomyces sp. TS71-3]